MMTMPQRRRLSFKKLSKTDSSMKYPENVATPTMHIMQALKGSGFSILGRVVNSKVE